MVERASAGALADDVQTSVEDGGRLGFAAQSNASIQPVPALRSGDEGAAQAGAAQNAGGRCASSAMRFAAAARLCRSPAPLGDSPTQHPPSIAPKPHPAVPHGPPIIKSTTRL
jgi:hypothetical protein